MTAALEKLLRFAVAKELLDPRDIAFARNALLAALSLPAPSLGESAESTPLPKTATPMLTHLCEQAVSRGLLPDEPFEREQFGAHLMNLLTPPPSTVIERFEKIRRERGVSAATDWFYALCRASDYIRADEIARNVRFDAQSPYGALEITINLSKPEKDPREIAKALSAPQVDYPACMLCAENEGYAGRPGYPSHETLRMIPVCAGGEPWFFQYSPYSYYDEHCIALNCAHIPMSISRRTFSLLFSLVDQFPHYFFGSNADLPIVGGSILSHDHFQGGRHVFPMDRARAYAAFSHASFPSVHVEAVRWPMSCVRLLSPEKEPLIDLAEALLAAWRGYDDPAHNILHKTEGGPHNTITPIARRMEGGEYVLQLVLRNNRTTDEHPLGIFHPHADLHHIKRENIGLIEVMGMFILPGRLRDELSCLAQCLTGARALVSPEEGAPLSKHFAWIKTLTEAHGNHLTDATAEMIIRDALSQKCVRVLEDAGVYKPTPAGDQGLAAFLASVGLRKVG